MIYSQGNEDSYLVLYFIFCLGIGFSPAHVWTGWEGLTDEQIDTSLLLKKKKERLDLVTPNLP